MATRGAFIYDAPGNTWQNKNTTPGVYSPQYKYWQPGTTFAQSTILDESLYGAGVIRPLTGAHDVSGASNGVLTVPTNTFIKDKTIDAFVKLVGTAYIENCEVKGTLTPYTNNGNSGGERCLVDTNSATPGTVGNVRNCTMRPTHPTAWVKAGIGDRYYNGWGNLIENTCDGYSAFCNPNESSGLCMIHERGSMVKQLVQFQPDGAVNNRSHTHGDSIQLQGNYGDETDIIFESMLIQSYLNPSIGQPSTVSQYGPRDHINGITNSPNVGYVGYSGTKRSSATIRYSVLRGGIQTVNVSGSTTNTDSRWVWESLRLQKPGTHAQAPSRAFVATTAYTMTVTDVLYEDLTAVTRYST